jgi:hypothetical protein
MKRVVIVTLVFSITGILLFCQVSNNIPEKHIKEAIKKLGSEDPALIDEAREALLYYGSAATDYLIQALKDEKIEVRFLACQLLGEIKDKKAIPALIELLDNKKTKVLSSIASCAAESLGLLQAKEAIPKLIESLDSQDAELKYSAIKSLGYLNATEAIEKVKKLLSDTSSTYYDGLIRAQAAKTIQLLGPEKAIEELKKLLSDTAIEKFTGKQVRYYAVRALQVATNLNFGDIESEEDPAKLEEIYNKWLEWSKSTQQKETKEEKKGEDNKPEIEKIIKEIEKGGEKKEEKKEKKEEKK